MRALQKCFEALTNFGFGQIGREFSKLVVPYLAIASADTPLSHVLRSREAHIQ